VTLDGVSTKDGDILVGVDTSINSVEISAGGEGGDFLDNLWGSLIDAAPEEDSDESGEGDDEDDEALNDE
jgi:hypothetical protein